MCVCVCVCMCTRAYCPGKEIVKKPLAGGAMCCYDNHYLCRKRELRCVEKINHHIVDIVWEKRAILKIIKIQIATFTRL